MEKERNGEGKRSKEKGREWRRKGMEKAMEKERNGEGKGGQEKGDSRQEEDRRQLRPLPVLAEVRRKERYGEGKEWRRKGMEKERDGEGKGWRQKERDRSRRQEMDKTMTYPFLLR
jgi:hypothetical protein